MKTNPNALAEAQSASEMFDVMQPPPATGFDIFTMKGVPTGEVKARGLVHRDRDWHRSVHVWLVDREKQLVALQKRSPNKVCRALSCTLPDTRTHTHTSPLNTCKSKKTVPTRALFWLFLK